MIGLLSDLDGTSGIEGKNVSWFRRIFGAEAQKYIIGERQVKQHLKGLSKEQLNELYMRITNDKDGMMFTRGKNAGVVENGSDRGTPDDSKLDRQSM